VIRYEVVLIAQARIAGALEEWMRQVHIPAILATGCFTRIQFDRSPTRLRTVYHAASRADFERYLEDHAEHFRADFRQHFPEGVEVARDVWETVEEWPAPRRS
jgi:hypothetical protein